MDRVVKVRRSFLNELRALLVAFRSLCDSCYRGACDCILSDEMARAKRMIVRIDNLRDAREERFYVEHPENELFDRILIAVRQGGGRVRPQEIRVGVSRQRKHKALKTLVRRGKLLRQVTDGETFYAIKG